MFIRTVEICALCKEKEKKEKKRTTLFRDSLSMKEACNTCSKRIARKARMKRRWELIDFYFVERENLIPP